ncbi:hypothetical protein [Citricoccus nitrophenolicus]|uniref:hypothetical protein n=1 Tax=Citricoccus nitrophenolicus TaxID=863575 RepID=UPI0031E7F8C9
MPRDLLIEVITRFDKEYTEQTGERLMNDPVVRIGDSLNIPTLNPEPMTGYRISSLTGVVPAEIADFLNDNADRIITDAKTSLVAAELLAGLFSDFDIEAEEPQEADADIADDSGTPYISRQELEARFTNL